MLDLSYHIFPTLSSLYAGVGPILFSIPINIDNINFFFYTYIHIHARVMISEFQGANNFLFLVKVKASCTSKAFSSIHRPYLLREEVSSEEQAQ